MEETQTQGWRKIMTGADIETLLHAFGRFHDSCLREVYVWTEQFVDEQQRMVCPSHLDVRIRMLFHRQWPNPSAIELLFEQVTGLHLSPAPENYDALIFEAWLTYQQDEFRWSDAPPQSETDATLVTAKVLWWRDVSEWMGETLRYSSDVGLPRTPGE